MNDFREIAPCGITLSIEKQGNTVGFEYRHSAPCRASLFCVYVFVRQRLPIATIDFGFDYEHIQCLTGGVEVYIASDWEGLFGRVCPVCKRYFRNDRSPSELKRKFIYCPYCMAKNCTHNFLTKGHLGFVKRLCEAIESSLEVDGDHSINLDDLSMVSDESGDRVMFFSGVSQQTQIRCPECNAFTDIIGVHGFCSCCGRRNSLDCFIRKINDVKDNLGKYKPQIALKEVVSNFDAYAMDIIGVLKDVPMVSSRKKSINGIRFFHNIERNSNVMLEVFGFDAFGDMNASDKMFVIKMFCRRHLHEHRAGVVDEKYLKDSGDESVILGQCIRENVGDIRRLIALLLRSADYMFGKYEEIVRDSPTP